MTGDCSVDDAVRLKAVRLKKAAENDTPLMFRSEATCPGDPSGRPIQLPLMPPGSIRKALRIKRASTEVDQPAGGMMALAMFWKTCLMLVPSN